MGVVMPHTHSSGPGTTYTRTGPNGDPAGRLADFARYAVAELEEISGLLEPDEQLNHAARRLIGHARALADRLNGYTTTANDDPPPCPVCESTEPDREPGCPAVPARTATEAGTFTVTREEYEAKRAQGYAGTGSPLHPDAPGFWVSGYEAGVGTVLYLNVEILERKAVTR